MNSSQNPDYLLYVGGYTTQFYRDYIYIYYAIFVKQSVIMSCQGYVDVAQMRLLSKGMQKVQPCRILPSDWNGICFVLTLLQDILKATSIERERIRSHSFEEIASALR